MHPQHTDYYLVYLRVNGCYFWFNVVQILITFSMLVCLYLTFYRVVSIIEILITFMVALDLIIRYFTEGTNNFIISWDNRINMFILIVLFVSIISDLAIPELTHHDGGIIASIFLFIRYGLQITRLCKLLLQSKKSLDVAKHQTISLTEIVEQETMDSIR